jgi:hypothetical protein
MAQLASCRKGRHGKSVSASVHTHCHWAEGKLSQSLRLINQSNVPNQCPVKRWCVLATVAAGIVTRLLAGRPMNRGSIATEGNIFVSSPKVKTGSGAHPAFCSVGTTDSFPGDNAAGT